MIDTSPFTPQQWRQMCQADMGMPVPLSKAELYNPFVYARGYGVFEVSGGHHHIAMATLLAFQHDLLKPIQVIEKLYIKHLSDAGDYWLINTPGTAFRSSVGDHIIVGKRGNLNSYERRWMKDVVYIDDNYDE